MGVPDARAQHHGPASLVDAMRQNDMATDGLAYVDANCHSVTWQWVNHLQGKGASDAVLTLVDGEALSSSRRATRAKTSPTASPT